MLGGRFGESAAGRSSRRNPCNLGADDGARGWAVSPSTGRRAVRRGGLVGVEEFHSQINHSPSCSACKAMVGILLEVERQTGVVVIVERTQRLMPHNIQSEALRNPLNRKAAKLIKFKSVNHPHLRLRYASVLV